MRSAQAMPPARGLLPALLRRRLSVLRVAGEHLHRAVPPPDGCAHQRLGASTRPRTPIGGWPAFRALRQPGAARSAVRLQKRGLHDRLRRQVPQRVRVSGPAMPLPAAHPRMGRASDVVLRLGQRRLGLLQPRASRPAALVARPHVPSRRSRREPRPTKDAAYAGSVHRRRRADRLHRARTRPSAAPYFLQVAPLRPAQPRSRRDAALPRRPALPAGLPRPADARSSLLATADALLVRSSWRCATCRATPTLRADNRPHPRRRATRPRGVAAP